MLTGGRPVRGRISKRGNRYLRMLFVQAARVVLLRPKSWERYGLKRLIEATDGTLATSGPHIAAGCESFLSSKSRVWRNTPQAMCASLWASAIASLL